MENNTYSEIKQIIFNSKNIINIIIILLVVLYFLSGIYSISQQEIGILTRFGKIINPNIKPGIHYSLPYPIDKVYKIPIKKINRILIDDFFENINVEKSLSSQKFYESTGLSSYCITGDNNILNISCVCQYIISNPIDYIFNIKLKSNKDKENFIKNIIINSIIHCIVKKNIDYILTIGKQEIANKIKSYSQKKINNLKLGITINLLEIKSIKPPDIVQQYFDDVINAKIDKEKSINQAESYKNSKLPSAKADAQRIINQALAYKNKVITQAEGETSRFKDILKNYQKSKNITKKKIYMDFIKLIYPRLKNKYIISNSNNKPVAQIKIKNSSY